MVSRKELLKRLFQPPKGTIPDYYHGMLIYRVNGNLKEDKKDISNNKNPKEDVER